MRQQLPTVAGNSILPAKRTTDLAEDEAVAPKRPRLDPSSPILLPTSPPSSPLPYAISEPPSDLTLAPLSPLLPSRLAKQSQIVQIAELPPKPAPQSQSRRRSTVKDFTLQQAGLYFHQPTRLLLCVECSTAVPAEHIPTHVNESCPRPVVYDRQILLSKLHALHANTDPVLPIEGLDSPIPLLPIIEGWRCEIPGACFGHVLGSQTTKNDHQSRQHPGEQPSFSVVKCQQVFKARNRIRYVMIKLSTHSNTVVSTNQMQSWRDIKKKLEVEGALTTQDDRMVTHTQLSPLENVTKWHLTLTGAHLGFARAYSREPKPDQAPSNHPFFFAAFKAYIVQIVAPVVELKSNTMLLRLINSPDKGTCERHPFRLPQNRSTVSHYAHIFSCMMTFVLRAVEKPIPGFPVTTTDAQLLNIRPFLATEALSDLSQAPPSFWEQIHALCWSLFTSIPVSAAFNELDIPLTRFLIAYHLRDDLSSRFQAATHICHNMIAIQWCWRAMALYECKKRAPQHEEGEIGVYESISRYLTEGGHSPFAVLRCHIHPITAISMQEPSLPLFLMGADMETFSFKSHPFTMSSFKTFAVGLLSSSESLLLSILDGLDISDLDARINAALSLDKSDGWFKDTLRDDEYGYSFLTDERNDFARYQDSLMDHICRNDSTRYAVHTPDGIQFKPNALLSFIDDVDELVEHLYASLNFTWAGAARGTEIEDIRFKNGHAPRNLYFTNGVLTFVTFYNKTQHNTGRPSMIPRAVPPRLARLFIILLAIIYPCTKYVASIQSTKAHAALYSSCIFVHRARPLDTAQMTEILRRFTQESFIFPLGVRDCRHLMKFVLKHAVGLALQEEPGDTPSLYRILDGLWGHSSKVSQTYYAVEEDTFSHIDAKDVTKAQIFSLAYHEWLGIGYDHLPANLRIQHNEAHEVQNPAPPAKINTASVTQSLNATIPILGDALQSTVFDAIQTYMDMHGIQPRRPQPTFPNICTSSQVVVHPMRSRALERLYGSTEPRFTSPQQAELFELVMQNTRHVLGILPTGGGKSLMFYGPPLIETEGITIVISPFAALAYQQYQEAKRYGIDVVQWPSSHIDCSTVRLLVVHAEQLLHGQLDAWLTGASQLGLIKRIIFDEAHEILISSGYRDCYSKVKQLMDLGVTIIFLTATIYRRSIPALAKAFEIDTLEVVAAPTMRTNIRYQVDTYGDQQVLMLTLKEAYLRAFNGAETCHRFLIYCHSYDECDRIANELRLPVYKARYTDDPEADAETRRQYQQAWLRGEPQGLVATTGFGTGINYAYVTHVFVVNPYDMVSVTQQTGRAGRIGQSAHATIMSYRPMLRKLQSEAGPDHAGKLQLYKLFTTNTCRRLTLGNFDDEPHSCHSLSGCTLCDYCETLEDRPPVPPHYAYPHQLVANVNTMSETQRRSTTVDRQEGPSSRPLNSAPSARETGYPEVDEGPQSSSATQTFFDKHCARPVTSLSTANPSASATAPPRPNGHHQGLALNQAEGQAKRLIEQDRAESFKQLCKLKDRCLLCQVFGRSPCGSESVLQCPVTVIGFKCLYEHEGRLLSAIYEQDYKPPLKRFDPVSRVCWICYFPFSYKNHTKNDAICQEQKDILIPIAWALFCLPTVLTHAAGQSLQDKILESAGITHPVFETAQGYSKWLVQQHKDIPNSSNLVELCIAFADLYRAKDWP
ncbi:hypothetical protein EYR36_010688 [Pleurotus pulmonarius]|nr:hypothetical protein EYR36_010688 [Pleurotus pulmonarius]KAF4590592.1 hypothetical protein EYR38_009894 [Pleurotus pulmonarius]